ncbi:MAG: hypothetical protein R6U98_26520, partial [Pirellulaceae bacterium]
MTHTTASDTTAYRSHTPIVAASERPSLPGAWAVALGLIAGWLAMGSGGVFVVSLQSVLVWLLLFVVAILSRPELDKKVMVAVAVIITLLLAAPRSFGWSSLQLPLAVATVLGLIAIGKRDVYRWLFLFAGIAVLAMVLFRFAQLQNPVVWMLSDRLGGQLGRATGFITGQSLRIGTTFAGLDFLVAMGVFGVGCFTLVRGGRLSYVFLSVVCVLLAQAVYLAILAFTSHITSALPPVAEPAFNEPYVPPGFCWSTLARQLLPWNLPALGAVLHGLATVLIIRWTPWRHREDAGEMAATGSLQPITTGGGLVVLGLLLPIVGVLNGIMYHYDSFVKRLLDAGATRFLVSIHGANEKTHDFLTRVKGSFNKTMNGIENLYKRGAELRFGIVINRYNYKQLREWAKMLLKYEGFSYHFNYVTPIGFAKNSYKELAPRINKVTPELKKAVDVILDAGFGPWIHNIYPCNMPGYEKMMSELMKKSTMISGADFKADIDKTKMDGRKKPTSCKKCKFNS